MQHDDAVWSYLDLDDAARYYLVREIAGDTESYVQSAYLFRDRGEGNKWHFSPLWDFGRTFNAPVRDLFVYHAKMGTTWLYSWMHNERFMDKVRETWVWFMQNGYEGLEEDIKLYSERISEAARRDAERWKGAPKPNHYAAEDPRDNSDMASKSTSVLSYLRERTDWLKSQYGDYAAMEQVDEPERDTTPAAPLPLYAVVSVEDVPLSPSDGLPRLYNLQGLPVTSPRPGELYIVISPDGSRKVRY